MSSVFYLCGGGYGSALLNVWAISLDVSPEKDRYGLSLSFLPADGLTLSIRNLFFLLHVLGKPTC